MSGIRSRRKVRAIDARRTTHPGGDGDASPERAPSPRYQCQGRGFLEINPGRAASRLLLERRDGTFDLVHRTVGSTVAAVTDEDGDVLMQEEFLPYGASEIRSGSSDHEAGFHGLRRDELIVAGPRAYEAGAGRWLARDPLQVAPEEFANLRESDSYGYAFDNPYKYRDPSGLGPDVLDTIQDAIGIQCMFGACERSVEVSHKPVMTDREWEQFSEQIGPTYVKAALLVGAIFGGGGYLLSTPVGRQVLKEGAVAYATRPVSSASAGGAGPSPTFGTAAPAAPAAAASGGGMLALLQQLAQQANAIVGPGKGPVHGTRVHTVFKGLVDALQLPNVHTEISYLNGNIAKYGTKGSVRLDVAIGSATAPTSAFDLKTGTAVLSQARVQQIRIHLPGVSMNIPITVVR